MFMLIFLEAWISVFALIDETSTDFNDLGKLMLLGFGAAVVFAVGFTFVRLRLKEKGPQTSSFISISSKQEKTEETGR
jgi:hypothetical protein